MKPLEDWNEEYVANLPSGEDDRFDRKSSQTLIDCASGQGADQKRLGLSCDLSAFANSGGGFLIFGANNKGIVDGGVSTQLKPNGTYDWLDALVGDLVEPVVQGYRIKQIEPSGSSSKIDSGRALYILSIPDSEGAPHQAKDGKYYIRINAHNYPARHQQIEDIRGRRRSPVVEGYIEFRVGQLEHHGQEGTVVATLWPLCHLSNLGRVTARDVSLVFSYPDFSRVRYTPIRSLVRCDEDGRHNQLHVQLLASIHPGQDLVLDLGEAILVFEYGTFLENNTKKAIRDIRFPATLYIENAASIVIDGNLGSDRVSRALRFELSKKFDWMDEHQGSYT